MTPRERFERWQRVLRGALQAIDALDLPDELDESFWAAMREAMLAAGATDAEIDALAAHFVAYVVEHTAAESDERWEQFELITQHLSCTDMHVRIVKGDAFVFVEFPSRQRIH
jgi:hypothetical protein